MNNEKYVVLAVRGGRRKILSNQIPFRAAKMIARQQRDLVYWEVVVVIEADSVCCWCE